MRVSEYEALTKSLRGKSSSNFRGAVLLFLMITLTISLFFVSLRTTGPVWFFSQCALGVLILQWFFLIHDLGHGHFFSHPRANVFFGHLGSVFVILPFFPWRYIHRHHHLWTGWKDKDPTMAIIVPKDLPPWQRGLMNFCWKYWVPIFSLSFSLSNFWNVPKLQRLYPDKTRLFVFSIGLVLLSHLALMVSLGWGPYWHTLGLANLVFFILSDPLLLSQHAGIPQHHSHGEAVGQFHFRDQEAFTRSLIFPRWARIYLFFGFNNHALHHLYPSVPCYHLSRIDHQGPNDVHWFAWLKIAKRMSAIELLCGQELARDEGEFKRR